MADHRNCTEVSLRVVEIAILKTWCARKKKAVCAECMLRLLVLVNDLKSLLRKN